MPNIYLRTGYGSHRHKVIMARRTAHRVDLLAFFLPCDNTQADRSGAFFYSLSVSECYALGTTI